MMKKTEKFIKKHDAGEIISDKKEFKELSQVLSYHNDLYNKEEDIITDSDYDKLYFLAQNSKEKNPEIGTAEMLTKVNEGESKLEKIPHKFEMLSLDKANSIEEVNEFLDKFTTTDKEDLFYTDGFIVERKEDGLTAVNYAGYPEIKNSGFAAVTRGTGDEGDDITANIIPTFPSNVIDRILAFSEERPIITRGEAIIDDEDFEKINIDGKYSNSRNLAAGSVKTLDPSIAKDRGVRSLMYNIENSVELGLKTEVEQLQLLISLYGEEFVSCPLDIDGKEDKSLKNIVHSREDVITIIEEFSNEKRFAIGHTIDGLVIKPNNIENRDEIGNTSHHPRNTLAYKFESPNATTKILDVIWQTGGSGQVTPVAIIDTVEILGARVSRASLANPGNIVRRDLMIGDRVLVQRSNDVIPLIVKSYSDQRTGEEIVIESPEWAELRGKLLFAKEVTEEQLINAWAKFASRKRMNIDGLSTKTIEALHNAELIDLTDYSSLYKMKKEDFINVDSLGEKKWNTLQLELEKSKSAGLSTVMASMGVYNVGNTLSTELTKVIDSWDEILKLKENDQLEEWLENWMENTNGVGPKSIAVLAENFMSEAIIKQMNDLEDVGVVLNTIKNSSEALKDIKIVVTGKTEMKRDDLKKLIQDNGGKLTGTISKNTDYLVTNADSLSKKAIAAEKLGVKVINESDLMDLINK